MLIAFHKTFMKCHWLFFLTKMALKVKGIQKISPAPADIYFTRVRFPTFLPLAFLGRFNHCERWLVPERLLSFINVLSRCSGDVTGENIQYNPNNTIPTSVSSQKVLLLRWSCFISPLVL